jgi:non-specific serine/threonine protein kinase
MGEVYRAKDPRLGRDVAVKILAADRVADSEELRRFEREARATAALSHPNVLTIFDVGAHEGLPYLVCELLEGRTLREHLASGPVPPEEAIAIGLQIARGVAAAHALRIIHRDLKPENLFLTRDGTIKILDFGLAKLRREVMERDQTATLDASMAGEPVGTPAYMAPEQVRGGPADHRVDLFAIGAILYEAVAGRNPFRRLSRAETLAAVLREPPAALPAGGTHPPGLERVILHCLEKDPEDRFQSAGDLVFALESALGEARRPAAVGERRRAGSIAVLPFTDMSPARDQDYLCEGMAEELINALTHVDDLRVAARSSSFLFRGSGVDIRAIGQRLGVATVLEGSVRKLGDRLRVTVQLVDVADGCHLWSERFDRNLVDVFAIQDEIARSVATALRGVLSQKQKQALRRPETAVEAYEDYLRGRQQLNRFTRACIETARGMFERAIASDPAYAPAYAGLADCHAWLYQWYGSRPEDLEAAERASSKALELAPELAEAHASRGFTLSLSRRYDEAGPEFEEAIRLNANLYDAYYYYGRTCFARGLIERSAELFRKAGEVRQEDFQSVLLQAQSLKVLGRTKESMDAYQEGIRRAERQLELNPTDARALSLGGSSLFDFGDRERAMRWSERALELYPDDGGVLINGACLRIKAGLNDEALELLERAFSRGWGKRDWIEHDPDYKPLRGNPRFEALLAKLP